MSKVKVTVMKKEFYPDLRREYVANPNVTACTAFEVGDEFLFDFGKYMTMYDGRFCAEAWDAISHYIYAGLQGGSIMSGWNKKENVMITCCNDGVRPVIFKIERIDD